MKEPRKCPECGQPMLPYGAVKKPGEYDHAGGCPLDPNRADPGAITMSICNQCGKGKFWCDCAGEVTPPDGTPAYPHPEIEVDPSGGEHDGPAFSFMQAGVSLADIARDGNVTVHGNVNEAAHAFWSAVGQFAPMRHCARCQAELSEDRAVCIKLTPGEANWLGVLAEHLGAKIPGNNAASALKHVVTTFAKSLGWE